MSKLPNAPLLEVIFEIKWKVSGKEDLEKYNYLHGDLYSELKNNYPQRESLIPPEIPLDILINKPMYRFRSNGSSGYPLYQIGPGIITLNTIEENYIWNDFYEWEKILLSSFFKVYNDAEQKQIEPSLTYIDFFELDFNSVNAYDFVNESLNIDFKQSFYISETPPNNINLGFYYDTEFGKLSINLRKGKNNKEVEGIIMQIKVSGSEFDPEVNAVLEWLNSTHTFSSNLFKEITKGQLYESFV